MAERRPIRLATVVFEPANGADETLSPIIFVHGFSYTKEYWHDIPQIVADATKRKAYTYDLRDHGESEWTGEYNCDLIAEDLYYFMDSKNISKAILIGHSAGGYAASRVAMKTPERVELIIMEDMHVCEVSRQELKVNWAYTLLWEKVVRNIPFYLGPTEAVRYAVDEVYNQIPPERQEALSSKESMYKCNLYFKKNEDGRYVLNVNMSAARKASNDTENFSSPPEGIYEGPAYFIYGGRSSLRIDQHEEEIRKHFPAAEFILVKNATHLVHFDAPEEVIDIFLECLLKSRHSLL